jgi:hypothetical protein
MREWREQGSYRPSRAEHSNLNTFPGFHPQRRTSPWAILASSLREDHGSLRIQSANGTSLRARRHSCDRPGRSKTGVGSVLLRVTRNGSSADQCAG